MLTLLSSPANNERGPRYMEKALAAIHQAGSRRLHITLAYGSIHGQLGLYLRCPNSVREVVVGPMAANYPECDFTVVEDESDRVGFEMWTVELDLVPELFPHYRVGGRGKRGKVLIEEDEFKSFIASCRVDEGELAEDGELRHIV